MAALRIAARRLVGGGGQTPAVSVGEAQRRFFPRLFQVERARSATSSAAAANSDAAAGKGLKETLDEIQNRTKQLYDLTAEAERMYDIPGKAGREVARLRQELAAQVEPTSKDMVWRVIRGKSNFERYGGFAAILFTTYMLTGMARGSIVELNKEERGWLKTKRAIGSKGKRGVPTK